MNLQQLVHLRNFLKTSIDLSKINEEIYNNVYRLENLKKDVDPSLQSSISSLIEQHKQNFFNFTNDVQDLEKIVKVVQDQIDLATTDFFSNNYKLEYSYNSPDTIRNVRVMDKNEEFESLLLKRINHHSSWKFPALEIGCRDGEWTKYLVASDPLYIADYYPEFFDSALKQFPQLYQSRVRKYLIFKNNKIYALPTDQLNFIFSYNFFNYLSLDSIKQFMIQSYTWLRPGGSILFTYNNADLPAAAAYAESYFMTYVPKSILVPMAESIGFYLSYSADLEPSFSIAEFTKPGELTTIKKSQVLGEIKSKL